MILRVYKFQQGTVGPLKTPELIPNPYYDQQMKAYNNSLNNRPLARLSAVMDKDLLAKFTAYREKNYPEEVGANITKAVYDPADMDGDLPRTFLLYYGKPSKMVKPVNNVNTPPPDDGPHYLHPNTFKPLDPAIYGRPEGKENVQISQYAFLNSYRLDSKKAEQEQQDNIKRQAELKKTLTPEQIQEIKRLNITPERYLLRGK